MTSHIEKSFKKIWTALQKAYYLYYLYFLELYKTQHINHQAVANRGYASNNPEKKRNLFQGRILGYWIAGSEYPPDIQSNIQLLERMSVLNLFSS